MDATVVQYRALDDWTVRQNLLSFAAGGPSGPWDRMIPATSLNLGVPLVTKDRSITAAGLVETIW